MLIFGMLYYYMANHTDYLRLEINFRSSRRSSCFKVVFFLIWVGIKLLEAVWVKTGSTRLIIFLDGTSSILSWVLFTILFSMNLWKSSIESLRNFPLMHCSTDWIKELLFNLDLYLENVRVNEGSLQSVNWSLFEFCKITIESELLFFTRNTCLGFLGLVPRYLPHKLSAVIINLS